MLSSRACMRLGSSSLSASARKGRNMKDTSKDFLKALLNTSSPSGFESPALDVWKEYLQPYATFSTNCYGNTTAHLDAEGGARVMLCGHIDEIGLMVKYINDEGFIYFDLIGGVDRINLIGRQITILNSRGPVKGVIARKAAHLLEEDEEDTVPKLHTLFIDIGAKDGDEASQMVAIGDPATVDSQASVLMNNRIVGRGLDNRVGAWVVAEVIRELHALHPARRPSIRSVATVQEEIGGYGAIMGTEENRPNCAIAIDLTHATDTPSAEKEKNGSVVMGDGPVLSIGSVVNKQMNSVLEEVADELRIPIQYNTTPDYTGTDADVVFFRRGGIPSALISVPNRYMHSPVEMVQLEDLENTVKLIVGFCEEIVKRGLWLNA